MSFNSYFLVGREGLALANVRSVSSKGATSVRPAMVSSGAML